MSYLDDFERSFMKHTLKIVEEYRGHFGATILVNCLLGLLVAPKETCIEAIPEDPISDLPEWGIRSESIIRTGKPTKKNPRPDTIRGIVWNLRNSVAHFHIKPVPRNADVHSFEYEDQNGMKAVISLSEMREFVRRLALHLEKS